MSPSNPPAVSSACTWCPTAAPAPTGCTTATRRSPTCNPSPRCARAAWSPTPSRRWPPSTRSWAESTADERPREEETTADERPREEETTADERPREEETVMTVFVSLGPKPEEPSHLRGRDTYPDDVLARLQADAQPIITRYPVARSALLPLLHLVQAEDGCLTPAGVEFCAAQLGLTGAEVTAVATFYSMY